MSSSNKPDGGGSYCLCRSGETFLLPQISISEAGQKRHDVRNSVLFVIYKENLCILALGAWEALESTEQETYEISYVT